VEEGLDLNHGNPGGRHDRIGEWTLEADLVPDFTFWVMRGS